MVQNIYIYALNCDKKHTEFLKITQIFLFFSEALSMCNQITNKNTDNSTT